MAEGYCEKCREFGPIEKHHILPKCDFGETGQIIRLCPTCHRKYHNALGKKNLKGNSMEFHFEKFFRWMAGLSIAVLIFFILRNLL